MATKKLKSMVMAGSSYTYKGIYVEVGTDGIADVHEKLAKNQDFIAHGQWAPVSKSVEVEVGVMTATVTAGEDEELGTADDSVVITKTKQSKPPVKKPAVKKYGKKSSKKKR